MRMMLDFWRTRFFRGDRVVEGAKSCKNLKVWELEGGFLSLMYTSQVVLVLGVPRLLLTMRGDKEERSRLVEKFFWRLLMISLVRLRSRLARRTITSLAIWACPSMVSLLMEWLLMREQFVLMSDFVSDSLGFAFFLRGVNFLP